MPEFVPRSLKVLKLGERKASSESAYVMTTCREQLGELTE